VPSFAPAELLAAVAAAIVVGRSRGCIPRCARRGMSPAEALRAF
jgi:hypothetical protein